MAKNTLPPGPWETDGESYFRDKDGIYFLWADVSQQEGREFQLSIGVNPRVKNAILLLPEMVEELRAYHALLGETFYGDGDDAAYGRITKILEQVDGKS